MARLTEYDYDLCIEICELIANGQNIINALESNPKFPAWPTFRRWKRDHEELRTLYINSMQDKAEALENEMDDYRSMLLAKEIDSSTYNTLVQTLKWKMAKFYPKMFGDKIDHTTNGNDINIKPIEFTIINENTKSSS